MQYQTIPVFARFQWVNHPRVVDMLSLFLAPPALGRKGYDKTRLFRWLLYKQLMRCSYRDLESITGIDHSTFVKFRQMLMASFLLPRILHTLQTRLITERGTLRLVFDSSFVETYSRHGEDGSKYSGYKKKNGFKLHSMIDFRTRLPLLQYATGVARADVVWGENLVRCAPPSEVPN